MPRQIRFLADQGEFKAGQIAVVDDQLAVDAIANGTAVPSIDPIDAPEAVAAEAVLETVAAEVAPEAETPAPEAPAAEAAPETVAAEAAPEVA